MEVENFTKIFGFWIFWILDFLDFWILTLGPTNEHGASISSMKCNRTGVKLTF